MSDTYNCEAGTVTKQGKSPVIKKCGKPTTRLLPPLNIAVCDDCIQQMKCRVSVWYDVNHLTGGDKYRECGNTLPCPRHTL